MPRIAIEGWGPKGLVLNGKFIDKDTEIRCVKFGRKIDHVEDMPLSRVQEDTFDGYYMLYEYDTFSYNELCVAQAYFNSPRALLLTSKEQRAIAKAQAHTPRCAARLRDRVSAPFLPYEVLLRICSFLPLRDRIRFACAFGNAALYNEIMA
jgi:hypothetical protein